MAEIPYPPDLSGGYFVAQYTNGVDTHRQRIHVYGFEPYDVTTGHYDYVVGGPSGTGADGDVATTVANWFGFVKAFYNNAWTFSLLSLWKRTGINTFAEQFPIPSVSAVVGTNASATTGITRATMLMWNMRTHNGRRARVVLVGVATEVPDVPHYVNANPAGNAEEKMIDYVTKATSGIVAHDGSKPVVPAHLTIPYNRRLRRHYNMA